MKTIAMCTLAFVILMGTVRADIPPPNGSRDHHFAGQPDEPKSYSTVAAGLALAAALGIGGVLAVRHLRENQNKPKASETAPEADAKTSH